jgi:hypothetical protein
MEFDLDQLKNDHLFETALDHFKIKVTELAMLKDQGYFAESDEDDIVFEEAVSGFIDKIKQFFQNIIDNIKKLAAKVKENVSMEMQKREVNKKLKEYKVILAKSKQGAFNGKKVKMFDTAKYVKAYTQYINLNVSENKKLYAKTYKDVDEYEKAYRAACEKLDNKYKELHLDDVEAYEISMSVNSAMTYTEKEIASWQNVQKLYQEAWQKAIEEQEKLALKEDDQQKVSDIKTQSTSFSSKCASGFKKIAKSPFTKLAIIGTVVYGVARSNKASFDEGYHTGYNNGHFDGFKHAKNTL